MKSLIKLCLSGLLVFIQTSSFAYRYNLPDLEDNFKLEDIEYIETEDGDLIPIEYFHNGILEDGQYHVVPVGAIELGGVIITLLISGYFYVVNKEQQDKDREESLKQYEATDQLLRDIHDLPPKGSEHKYYDIPREDHIPDHIPDKYNNSPGPFGGVDNIGFTRGYRVP